MMRVESAPAGLYGVFGMTTRNAGSAGRRSVPHKRLQDEKQLYEYYEFGDKLGEGSFGVVKEVTCKTSEEKFACKIVNKEKAGSSKVTLLEREVHILKKVHNDHIIQLHEVYETPTKMFLVMELCSGGELSHELVHRGCFSESDARILIKRLAEAISYLHKNDMVHRDIKLENILLGNNPDDSDDKLYIKVTDFGLSVVKDGPSHESMMVDFCGTPMYMAPEIIDNKTYGQLCDVWALGVISYCLLCGEAPFVTTGDEEIYDVIKNTDIVRQMDSKKQFVNISSAAKDVVRSMLTVDPAHRVTASEILNSPFITGSLMKEGPRNVLELMKKFREDEEEEEEGTSAINGEAVSVPTPASKSNGTTSSGSSSSSPPSRSTSAKKSPGGSRRNSSGCLPPKSSAKGQRMPRNITDPNLQATGSKPSSVSTRTTGTALKSKSPTDRQNAGSVRHTTKGGHHNAGTTATRTVETSKTGKSTKGKPSR